MDRDLQMIPGTVDVRNDASVRSEENVRRVQEWSSVVRAEAADSRKAAMIYTLMLMGVS